VQITKCAISNLNAPPDRRLYSNQCDFELEEEIRFAARLLAGLRGLRAEDTSLFFLKELGGFLLDSKQPFFVRTEGIVSRLPSFFVQLV
jgi:hypothetical protein